MRGRETKWSHKRKCVSVLQGRAMCPKKKKRAVPDPPIDPVERSHAYLWRGCVCRRTRFDNVPRSFINRFELVIVA